MARAVWRTPVASMVLVEAGLLMILLAALTARVGHALEEPVEAG